MGKVGTEPWRESGNDGESGEDGPESGGYNLYLRRLPTPTYLIEGIQYLCILHIMIK